MIRTYVFLFLKLVSPFHLNYVRYHLMSLIVKSPIYAKVMWVFLFWFLFAKKSWFVKNHNCYHRKTTDYFHETTDCFPSGNIALKLIYFSMHWFCFWFLLKAIMSQNCTYHSFEFTLKGSYDDHKWNIFHIFLEN